MMILDEPRPSMTCWYTVLRIWTCETLNSKMSRHCAGWDIFRQISNQLNKFTTTAGTDKGGSRSRGASSELNLCSYTVNNIKIQSPAS